LKPGFHFSRLKVGSLSAFKRYESAVFNLCKATGVPAWTKGSKPPARAPDCSDTS
jgi:hypothetical protein